jgi:hypothetical protein
MQLGSSKDSFACFTRLNPCIAPCSTVSIPWVHHSREEGSLDYDEGFVRLQIHMKFDTNLHRQHRYLRLLVILAMRSLMMEVDEYLCLINCIAQLMLAVAC